MGSKVIAYSRTLIPRQLITSRLSLRQTLPSDVDRFFEIFSNPETQLFNPAGPIKSIEESETVMRTWCDHWQNYGFGHWAISTIENPEAVLGFGGLLLKGYSDDDALRLNLGFRFEPSAWGKGYATELGNAALYTAFRLLNFETVFARVRTNNTASLRVLQKLNMHMSGALDEVPGKEASLIYQMSATEFLEPEVIPTVKDDFAEK